MAEFIQAASGVHAGGSGAGSTPDALVDPDTCSYTVDDSMGNCLGTLSCDNGEVFSLDSTNGLLECCHSSGSACVGYAAASLDETPEAPACPMSRDEALDYCGPLFTDSPDPLATDAPDDAPVLTGTPSPDDGGTPGQCSYTLDVGAATGQCRGVLECPDKTYTIDVTLGTVACCPEPDANGVLGQCVALATVPGESPPLECPQTLDEALYLCSSVL